MADETYKSTYSMEKIIQAIDFTKNQIAEVFSETGTYAYGDYVVRNDLLYRCTSHEAQHGTWVPKNWAVYTRIFNNNEGSNILIVDGGKSYTDITQSGPLVTTNVTFTADYDADMLNIN